MLNHAINANIIIGYHNKSITNLKIIIIIIYKFIEHLKVLFTGNVNDNNKYASGQSLH